MKKLFSMLSIVLMIFAGFLGGCMSDPEGPVGEPDAQSQQSAGAVAAIVSSVINEDGENLTNFTWNLFDDTYYQDGWWHTSFAFTLSTGDNGTLGLDANFQDDNFQDQFLPGPLTVRMETIVDFDGTFWTFPTTLDADLVLTRDPGGKVLTIGGNGTLIFDTMNLTFSLTDLVVDLDVLYPVGQVTAKMVDEHLGSWDIVITFDGTEKVLLEMNNGVSTFQFTLDLSTGQIA